MTKDLEKLNTILIDWFESDKIKLTEKKAITLLEQAELAIQKKTSTQKDNKVWHTLLDYTSKPAYLTKLVDTELRNRWAEVVFKIIQVSQYSLKDLFDQRVKEKQYDILFQDMSGSGMSQLSYIQVQRHVKEIATVFYNKEPDEPRVAIYSENSIESACCDLACLFYDIFDTPLNANFFNKEILSSIFKQVNTNIVVTDTAQRFNILEDLRKEYKLNFSIFVTDSNILLKDPKDYFLGEQSKSYRDSEITAILGKRTKKDISSVATTMFTSGSTGLPKGVSFSIYNLVSKRFARGAALPSIGNRETMLCYLPLYHTFGRYLEMLGTIYWRGKYVFVGNPSKEVLLSLFPKINPSIFISIPLRWEQLGEEANAKMGTINDQEQRKKILKKVVGKRLKWGLSAAGYLEPKIFRFFQDNGVKLCSGFGMTEATGGITMTLPGEYYNDSTGIPLPGVDTHFRENGELEISGHYIARYLDKAGPGDQIPFPGKEKKKKYLPTGDIFKVTKNGHYSIVDRVKDIYKNNKGQTIAPRTVEQKFIGVPGIKRTFLVGDAKPYNTLLIVPDMEDPVLKASGAFENKQEYFHQIVTAANKNLAPFERVINFLLLERDFDLSKGELTPKGSLNRKSISTNFEKEIEKLYQRNYILLKNNSLKIKIHRWFYRDLGILETDIALTGEGLENKVSGLILPLRKEEKENMYLIGDLMYRINDDTIELGLFARQPRLWIDNPCLIKFSPCKEGWDIPLNKVSAQVFLPKKQVRSYPHNKFPNLSFVKDQKINFINNLLCCSLFSEASTALSCTRQIGDIFGDYDEKIAVIIRRRLEALSCHKDEQVRTQAYQTLLLKDPHNDYSKMFPTFIQSGQSFLTEKSIKEIASKEIGKHKLESLRQRLFTYRKQLSWPADPEIQKQFKYLLRLLYHFAMENLDYYIPIRSELASWILHRKDPVLAHVAKKYFIELNQYFEKQTCKDFNILEEEEWNEKLWFDPGIVEEEKENIKDIFIGTYFLQQSVKLAYGEDSFKLVDIPKNEIWITKLSSNFYYRRYRVSINTTGGKHYDLNLMLNDKLQEPAGMEMIYLWAAISGHSYGSLSLPSLGCSQPRMGAITARHMSELTCWDKIREYAGLHYSLGHLNKPNAWKKLIIKAIKVYFKIWEQSNYQLLPGLITPENVVVPELDYLDTATIQSLTGTTKYESTLSLIQPLVWNFYNKTTSHYPWCNKQLDLNWIFDACIEILGQEKSNIFLKELKEELEGKALILYDDLNLQHELENYIKRREEKYYLPIALFNAIDQYKEWETLNPGATSYAKEQMIFELSSLFRLNKFPEIVRYNFYYKTYFNTHDKAVKNAFKDLLLRINENVTIPAFQHTELSDLQSTLSCEEDSQVFSRMVFSRLQNYQKIDLLKIGEDKDEHIVVTTELTDKNGIKYNVREPIDPSEIGQLYRLFFEENYPKSISEMDKHILVLDKHDHVIGGLCYIPLENDIVLLDGAAVTTSLKGRGIGSAMIEDFSARMAVIGTKVIKAHYLHGSFYLKLNFKVDKKWGALVKFL
ncbi:MAG: AMP-binding protein [Bacteroidales bacterium]|nr:AMP-binding protein [Bacteroidales bacterium]